MKEKRTLLVDADILIFNGAVKGEDTIWLDAEPTYVANFDVGRHFIDSAVEDMKTELGADRVVMALSDYSSPWRKNILPSYKENRSHTRKPEGREPLRKYVHEVYQTVQIQGLEGDDVLGILMTLPWDLMDSLYGIEESERVCTSLDKDMRTIPGLHWNWKKKDQGIIHVSQYDADHYHMTQTLTGDRVDGYFGLPKVGPVRAAKILDGARTVKQMWHRVASEYRKRGYKVDDALTQARCARICRATDYNFETGEVILWSPPE